jgi:glycosyltransferase involved in cell wall biosynthesis
VVLHFGDTPTLHYYWTSRFPHARYVDTASAQPDVSALRGASSVVLVRHVAPAWGKALRDASDSIPPVIYFFDDDIPGILRDPYLPFGYAFRTARRFAGLRRTLRATGAAVLVSCQGLAARYDLPESAILPPLPPVVPAAEAVEQEERGGGVTVFYHGTASHLREIGWLREVIEGVSARLPDTVFELFGDARVRRMYRRTANVRVVHPLPWAEFLARTGAARLDIGLAPLLDSPFNRCRSHVKFYDITRAGGVGVYSAGPVFEGVVRDGENGLLVENSTAAWVEAICRLARDRELRGALRARAVALVQASAAAAGDRS